MLKGIVTELRLLICQWLMRILLWVAPKNNSEGMALIDFIGRWATIGVEAYKNRFK